MKHNSQAALVNTSCSPQMAGKEAVTELQTVRSREQVINTMNGFLKRREDTRRQVVARLQHLRNVFANSPFFQKHEVMTTLHSMSNILVSNNSTCIVPKIILLLASDIVLSTVTLSYHTSPFSSFHLIVFKCIQCGSI